MKHLSVSVTAVEAALAATYALKSTSFSPEGKCSSTASTLLLDTVTSKPGRITPWYP